MIASARFACALGCIATLAGCASTMSGLGGSDTYACKAPQGVICTSVAGVYANAVENNLPSQRVEKRANEPATKTTSLPRTAPLPTPSTNNTALRSSPRVLRLWVAPWEDSDGDLHEQSMLYVMVDSGRWLIEHQRSAIRDEFMPIAPPRTMPPVASGGSLLGKESRLPLPAGGITQPALGGPTLNETQPDAK